MQVQPSEQLDLRGIPCPTNAAKALIKIAIMDQGELLEILIDDGEPMENLPPALTEEGHQIVSCKQDASCWTVWVQVGA